MKWGRAERRGSADRARERRGEEKERTREKERRGARKRENRIAVVPPFATRNAANETVAFCSGRKYNTVLFAFVLDVTDAPIETSISAVDTLLT